MSSNRRPVVPERSLVDIITPTPWPAIPAGQESLAALDCAPMTDGSRLRFTPLDTPGTLVLASAFDKRGPCRLELSATGSVWTSWLDVGFCSNARRYHIAVPPGVGDIAVRSLDEDAVFWVLADANRLAGGLPAVWSESGDADRLARFFDRLEHDSIALFGWMDGCVTEALDALGNAGDRDRWHAARDAHLAAFIRGDHLHYQDPHGRPLDDVFTSIETPLPIATLARTRSDHPVVSIAMEYLRGVANQSATCEGCYTVAYPLAQVGMLRGDESLVDLAYGELEHRRQLLFHEGDVYLRYHDDGRRTYRSWARGVGWYLLGFAECLKLTGLNGRWAAMAGHVQERARWVLTFQRPDGLWDNFLHEPGLPPDTSGSAAIAAALLVLHEIGLLGDEAVAAARRCWEALPRYLHIDGWLGGTSPSNKRGEGPQHLPDRASESYGMGLMGRLAAEIGRTGSR